MASSGAYSYQPTTYQLIQGAARLVSAIQTGETLPDDEYADMLFALNGMISAWQASGIHVWSQLDATLFLQPGQILYQLGDGSPDRCCATSAWLQTANTVFANTGATSITVAETTTVNPNQGAPNTILSGDHFGVWLDDGTIFWTTVAGAPSGFSVPIATPLPSPASSGAQIVDYTADLVRPLRVPQMRRYTFAAPGGSPIETPMSSYSQLDYAQVPNKNTPGTPTAGFFQPTLGLAQASIWPNPDSSLWAVKFTAQRPLQDFLTQGNTADLPIEWSSAIRFNLAKEISLEYDVPADRSQRIKDEADEKFAVVQMWDREPQSVYFGVQSFPSVRN
jgi:hypothetical protein